MLVNGGNLCIYDDLKDIYGFGSWFYTQWQYCVRRESVHYFISFSEHCRVETANVAVFNRLEKKYIYTRKPWMFYQVGIFFENCKSCMTLATFPHNLRWRTDGNRYAMCITCIMLDFVLVLFTKRNSKLVQAHSIRGIDHNLCIGMWGFCVLKM